MAQKLTEALAGLFPTTDPKAATKGSTGATLTKGRSPSRQDGEANYLPLLALGAAAILVVWAMLTPGPLLGSRVQNGEAWEPSQQDRGGYQEQRYEEDWQASSQEE